MTMAASVKEFLHQRGIHYDIIAHTHTSDSMRTAGAAHVPGDLLAKCVMLEDDKGYLMAVVPSTHRVDLGVLRQQLDRRLGLANEAELGDIFKDCERGAVPPLGTAYGIEVMVDDSLAHCKDIYFEAGDHTDLVHVSGEDFLRLLDGARRGQFSHHV
ncbi:MAG: aminoacyl-tRNA deacylase [Chromatiales bacterium]